MIRLSHWMRACLLVCTSLVAPLVLAQDTALPMLPAPQGEGVPESLRAWIPWVMHGQERRFCPVWQQEHLCDWSTPATFDVRADGATLQFRAFVGLAGPLRLPGSADVWPAALLVDGVSQPIASNGQQPLVELTPGWHDVNLAFAWGRRPESIRLPDELVLGTLTVDSVAVPYPRREATGMLWLNAGETAEAGEQDRLQIDVQRRLTDSVPAYLTTRLRLQVSGDPRELNLGNVLPEAFRAHGIETALPARLAADGTLLVQVRAGSWDMTIMAHRLSPIAEISFLTEQEAWPASETWVFEAVPSVRSVQVSGAPGIDPQRTALPEDWKSLPAFLMEQGTTLQFEELRRGEATPPPDALSVQRTLWLRTDGSSFVASDTLSGTLSQGTRLQESFAGALQRADVQSAGRVITTYNGGLAGVEVREGAIQISADQVYPTGAELPAVGWNRDATTLRVDLQTPPGWTLVSVSGADEVVGSWVRAWNLQDLFILLLVALAIRQVLGTPAALMAAVVLALAWHEHGVPQLIWLTAVILMLLVERLGNARLGRWLVRARWVVLVVLLIQSVQFVGSQSRLALFPQLDLYGKGPSEQAYDYRGPSHGFGDFAAPMQQVPPPGAAEPTAPPMEPVEQEVALDEAEMNSRTIDNIQQAGEAGRGEYMNRNQFLGGSLASDSDTTRSSQIDPSEVIQTGPGLPRWSWRSASLHWSGPVSENTTIRFWLLSPLWTSLVGLVRALGVFALALLLLRRTLKQGGGSAQSGANPSRGTPTSTAQTSATAPDSGVSATAGSTTALHMPAVLLAIGLALLPALLPATAQAQETWPPTSLLDTLRDRLLVETVCNGPCAQVNSMIMTAGPAGLDMELEVHATKMGVVALPGPDSVWTPTMVAVNGVDAVSMRRNSGNGHWLLVVPEGISTVRLSGAARDSMSLAFGSVPRRLTVNADGWTVAGYRADAEPPASIELARSTPMEREGSEEIERSTLPALTEVHRELDIGVPWAVHSRLVRRSPTGAAVLVQVPLLPGESVTTPGIIVTDGVAQVQMGPQATETRWDSTLAEVPELTLVAPEGATWTEVWTLNCSPVFHCEYSGLPPVQHMAPDVVGSVWRPSWRPWPGETVTVAFSRPTPVVGAWATIDDARLSVSGGNSLRDSTLTFSFRSSQGGEQTLQIPVDARIQAFEMDGVPVPVTPVDGAVRFTVDPGVHNVLVRWRQDVEPSVVDRTPLVSLGSGAANVTIEYNVPTNRWLIWTGGPMWGPVVTLWQYLLALALGAALLGRFSRVPGMGFGGWLLLAFGTCQTEFAALLVVVAWLELLAWRGRNPSLSLNKHNLSQLLIVAATPVAVVSLILAIENGLRLYPPDMGVQGAGSNNNTLFWYADNVASQLPQGWVVSLPLWVWHALMLLWALWVAWRCVVWARWGWAQFGQGGLWKRNPRPVPDAGAVSVPADPSVPGAAAASEREGEPRADAMAVPEVELTKASDLDA
jgi:hypothetical protein